MSKDKGISKQELKTPDAFAAFFQNLRKKLSQFRSGIIGFCVISVVGLALYSYSSYRQTHLNKAASDAFVSWLDQYEASEDKDELLKSLTTLSKSHNSSSFKGMFLLYQAKIEFEMSEYEKAQQSFLKASSELKSPYQLIAREGQANSLMEQEKYEEAVLVFQALVSDSENPLLAQHLWKLGLAQEAKGNLEDASKTYQKIVSEYKDSPVSTQAGSRLVLLGKSEMNKS